MSTDLLRAEEVAERLGVSRSRVYQLATIEGRLPYIKIGRTVRFPRTAWNAWLAQQSDTALSAVRAEGEFKHVEPTT